MKKTILLIALLSSLCLAAWSISIYDIQYTTSPGSDNTYPSRFAGKQVSTEGIVTATDFKSGGFFVSEPVTGAYSGLFISDRRSNVNVGDRIRLTGTVVETFGMTSLSDITALTVLERKHPLPHPVILTTAQLTRAEEAEAYECVYAKVLSVSTASSKNLRSKLIVSDGTGLCPIQLNTFSETRQSKQTATQFASITGVVVFGFGEFSLNPISNNDIIENQPVSIQNRSWGKIKSIYK